MHAIGQPDAGCGQSIHYSDSGTVHYEGHARSDSCTWKLHPRGTNIADLMLLVTVLNVRGDFGVSELEHIELPGGSSRENLDRHTQFDL